MTLSLQPLRSDQSLDLGSFEILRFAFLLGEWSFKDVFSDIVLLIKIVQLPDLPHALWPQTSRDHLVRQAWDVPLPLLDNDQIEHAQSTVNDAPSHGLASTLAGTSWSKARLSLLEEKLDSATSEDALFHGKALLVVPTSDANCVPLQLSTPPHTACIGMTSIHLLTFHSSPRNSQSISCDMRLS